MCVVVIWSGVLFLTSTHHAVRFVHYIYILLACALIFVSNCVSIGTAAVVEKLADTFSSL